MIDARWDIQSSGELSFRLSVPGAGSNYISTEMAEQVDMKGRSLVAIIDIS